MNAPWLAAVGRHLEELHQETDHRARLASDPVCFAHRYRDARDQELAAVLASSLAYGRVAAIWRTLEQLFSVADARGGPRDWVLGFDVDRDAGELLPLVHRWNRGRDVVLLVLALQDHLREGGLLGDRVQIACADDLAGGLGGLIEGLRAACVAQAWQVGLEVQRFGDLPRGVRYLLPTPRDGSACKRWNLALRWLVRRDQEGVDLGLWTHVPASALLIPLDTHVHRMSLFLGLTRRRDGSWRTAREITDSLARLDPLDPVRFDFALAHLGISGACRGGRHPEVCPGCPLDPVCRAPALG